ncbi:MAG: hypothetical protein ABSB60_05010 [Terracidiphilus sp.]|jgi:hypothetical protein
MSKPNLQPETHGNDAEDRQGKAPSLTAMYGLLALALVAAIGFALLIVLPFYHRR